MLLDLVGARQGGGDKVHGVDAAALKKPLEQTIEDWAHSATPPRVNVAGVPELETLKNLHTELRRLSSSVEKEREALVSWHARCEEWLGPNVDKNELTRLMKEAVASSQEVGLAPSANARTLQKTIEEFRQASVKTALDDAARLVAGTSRGLTLAVLARNHDAVIEVTDRLSVEYDAFEIAVRDEIKGKAATLGADPLREAVEGIQHEVDATEVALGGLVDGN